MKSTIGIIAYGSLIDDPGSEIEPLIINRVKCITPFAVEYGRISSTRDNAPTLIPTDDKGSKVPATILVLNPDITREQAEDMLWRRETRNIKTKKPYPRKEHPGVNKVQIICLNDVERIDRVLYTKIGQNIPLLNGEILAGFAIESILNQAGERNEDGIRYLLNNINNKIITPLTSEYERKILEFTNTSNLEDAISVLDDQRPAALRKKSEDDIFESSVTEIADLICEYGLNKTLEGSKLNPKKIQSFIKNNREIFMKNCHDGFKKAQEKILKMMLAFEAEKEQHKFKQKKIDRKKDKVSYVELQEQIERITAKEDILRHLIDTMAWQMIGGQLYIARRLYQGVKGKKLLRQSNIQSVRIAASEINNSELDFALITDLSAYLQSGDLLLKKGDGSIGIVEVKEGEKNKEVLNLMDEMLNGEKSLEEIFKNKKLDKKTIQQLDRNLKQFSDVVSMIEILQTDKGTDKSGKKVNIITPKEDTPRFDERLRKLYDQLEKRNLWAYDVVDNCLHIGLYKGQFRYMGPLILQSLGDHHGGNYILVDFLIIIKSLHKPLLFLPFPKPLLFDIMFGRVKLYFMLNLDEFFNLFNEFGLTAEWLSRSETMKLVENQKDNQFFIYKHRAIGVKDNLSQRISYLQHGLFGKIFFEHIYPSYTAYTFKYYLRTEEN